MSKAIASAVPKGLNLINLADNLLSSRSLQTLAQVINVRIFLQGFHSIYIDILLIG